MPDPTNGIPADGDFTIDDARDLQRLAAARSPNGSTMPVDPLQALETLVRCDGDLTMASVALSTTPAAVLAAIVGSESHHDILSKYLRAYATTKAFGVINALHTKLEEVIDELSPRDVARTLVSLMDSMARLTDTNTAEQQADPLTTLTRRLPAHLRDRMLVIANQQDSSNEDAA